MLQWGKTYEEIYNSFKWDVPEFYNIGVDVCDKWADDRSKLALIDEDWNGKIDKYTFWDIKNYSNQLANALISSGIERGDRIGIVLSQCVEAVISDIAIFKIGAIALPLLTLFGPDALEYRLGNSETKIVITDKQNVGKILGIKDKLPHLKLLIVKDANEEDGIVDFWQYVKERSIQFEPVKTKADDPAVLIYTSGTTGNPKGALHAHRVLLGHMPAVEYVHNFFPKKGDLMWSPAEWAWIAGLLMVLLPSMRDGVPVLAYRPKKFDGEEIFALLSRHQVRNSFMPPTVLRMLRLVKDADKRMNYKMRSIVSGGESLSAELRQWTKDVLGADVNEIYGQTEVHLSVGGSNVLEYRPGAIGKPTPGRKVEVVDDKGDIVAPNTVGEIAVKLPDPIAFLGYWRDQEATAGKMHDGWVFTGDMATKDDDGYIRFVGRSDDMIKSSGYRIGPDEVEHCLQKHPACRMASVIGSPDELRGVIVKAYVVLKKDATPCDELKADIQNFVKGHLAAYEYPREIEFIDRLPLGLTGKVLRKELRKIDLEMKAK